MYVEIVKFYSMGMAIDFDRATKAGKRSTNKGTMSISIDRELQETFSKYCEENDLKASPVIEDLISQYMEAVRARKKKS